MSGLPGQLAQFSKIYIEGTAATPEVITAITVGYPTILAMTGHAGVANGDVVALAGFTGDDAATLNGKSFVATHLATGATNDTFSIDVNTVGKTITIDAGVTAATPSAWIQMLGVKGMNPSGATANKIDDTDLESTSKEFQLGLPDNGTLTMEIKVVETDAGQAAFLAAFTGGIRKNFKQVTATPKTRTFAGVVTKFPTFSAIATDGIQTGSVEISVSGTPVVS